MDLFANFGFFDFCAIRLDFFFGGETVNFVVHSFLTNFVSDEDYAGTSSKCR